MSIGPPLMQSGPQQQAGAAAPAQDPALAAYLRAIGFDDTAARAEAAKQISDVNARAMFQQPEIDYQGQLAMQSVDQDALGRGVWSSGEHQMGLARAQHATQYQTGALALNQSQAVGDAQLALARALASDEARRQTLLAGSSASSAGSGYYAGSAYN